MQTTTMSEIRGLEQALVFVEDLRAGRKDDPSASKLGLSVAPLQSAARSAASATGPLSCMSYDEVQRFATAYKNQALFEAAVQPALEHYEILETYVPKGGDPRDLNTKDVDTAIPDLRLAIADLGTLYDAGRGALSLYDAALKN